jgi:hypothetical protein
VLDEELDAYKRSPDQRPQVFRVSASANVSERPLSPAEAIMTRLRLERRWAPGELESELERALALDPANVRALTTKRGELPPARRSWPSAPCKPTPTIRPHGFFALDGREALGAKRRN